MKKNLLLTAVLIALTNAFSAQSTIDFETLTVPAEGYYNGSSDHSGNLFSTETYTYSDNGAEFHVTYTLGSGFDYWNGFAYSNQTDLETADWNNYSAYASPAGGYDGSDNYSFAYIFIEYGDSIMFTEAVDVNKIQVTNSTWAYHYMNGTDETGVGIYEIGDYFKLNIIGILENGNYTNPIEFYLADFTNGNSIIIDNWTEINLNSLGSVKGLKFEFNTSDDWTPTYLCFDDLVYNSPVNISDLEETNISVFPNPTKGIFNIENVLHSNISINTLSGKTVFSKNNCTDTEQINASHLIPGLYFINVHAKNQVQTEKIIIQ